MFNNLNLLPAAMRNGLIAKVESKLLEANAEIFKSVGDAYGLRITRIKLVFEKKSTNIIMSVFNKKNALLASYPMNEMLDTQFLEAVKKDPQGAALQEEMGEQGLSAFIVEQMPENVHFIAQYGRTGSIEYKKLKGGKLYPTSLGEGLKQIIANQ